MILIDTDIFIDMLRGRPEAINWLSGLAGDDIILPGYVAMEAIQGCRDKHELQRTQREISNYQIVWSSPADCAGALNTFAGYHLSHALGLIDSLIAHTAISLDTPLHTMNVKHYSCVPGLKWVVPYKRTP